MLLNFDNSETVNEKKKVVALLSTTSRVPRTIRMATAIQESGFEVHVLEWDRECNKPNNEMMNGVHINSFKLKSPYGIRSVFYFPLWFLFITVHILIKNYDVIQPQNLDNLIIVWILSKIKKYHIVYDLADCYAEGYLSGISYTIEKALLKIERKLVTKADIIILVNPMQLKQLSLKPNNKFVVVYNSPEEYGSQNMRHDDDDYYNISNVFSIFYGGILTSDRGINYFPEVVGGIEGVVLIIAGFGELEGQVKRMAINDDDLCFLGKVTHEKILYYTNISDCIVALYDPRNPNNKYASPNKLFEAMLFGKPIIVSRGTFMADVVSKEKCGLVVTYGNKNELKKAIITLRKNSALARQLGKNGRNAYLNKYSWNIAKEKLLKRYEQMLQHE